MLYNISVLFSENSPFNRVNYFSGEFFHTSHSEPGTQILTPAKTLRGEVAAEVVKVAKVAYRYTA
jgi:hypothetical protein